MIFVILFLVSLANSGVICYYYFSGYLGRKFIPIPGPGLQEDTHSIVTSDDKRSECVE